MNPMISMVIEIPEDLYHQIQAFIQEPGWDIVRFSTVSASLLLLLQGQVAVGDRPIQSAGGVANPSSKP
jgi:hypothetical protein